MLKLPKAIPKNRFRMENATVVLIVAAFETASIQTSKIGMTFAAFSEYCIMVSKILIEYSFIKKQTNRTTENDDRNSLEKFPNVYSSFFLFLTLKQCVEKNNDYSLMERKYIYIFK